MKIFSPIDAKRLLFLYLWHVYRIGRKHSIFSSIHGYSSMDFLAGRAAVKLRVIRMCAYEMQDAGEHLQVRQYF